MGLIGDIKDIGILIQKAGNIELYEKVLNIQAMAIDMQEELREIKEENAELRKNKDLEEQIERHDYPYITLKNCDKKIKYCAICWGKENNLIQMRFLESHNGHCSCANCKNLFNIK